MNKLLTTITLLCFSVAANAQEKEIWACQSATGDGAAVNWQNGSTTIMPLSPTTLLLTIDGVASNLKLDGEDIPAMCTDDAWVSCLDETDTYHLILDKLGGQAALSSLFAAVLPKDFRNENGGAIYAVYFSCSKF